MPQNKSLLEEESAVEGGETLLNTGKAAAKRFVADLPSTLQRLSGLSTTTKRVLITAGMITGIIVVSYIVGIPQALKQRRENRQWVVTNKLTPQSLLARCGTPLTDETKDLYPMIARDISYKTANGATALFKFSRTSEEGSDWVFMSMEDASTGATFDTPIAKISAMGCLDASK